MLLCSGHFSVIKKLRRANSASRVVDGGGTADFLSLLLLL
jgi:hypothetical protein